eukprot:36566-Rhodomonas_salina.1
MVSPSKLSDCSWTSDDGNPLPWKKVGVSTYSPVPCTRVTTKNLPRCCPPTSIRMGHANVGRSSLHEKCRSEPSGSATLESKPRGLVGMQTTHRNASV